MILNSELWKATLAQSKGCKNMELEKSTIKIKLIHKFSMDWFHSINPLAPSLTGSSSLFAQVKHTWVLSSFLFD